MMDKDQKADPVASNHGWSGHIEGLSRWPLLVVPYNSKQTQISHIILNRPHPPNFPRETVRVNRQIHQTLVIVKLDKTQTVPR